MSLHLVQPLQKLTLHTSLNAESSSSTSNKSKEYDNMNGDFDEDELVWLGGVYDPPQCPSHEVHDQVKEVWCQDEWDCPTDILYHHAENEDHIPQTANQSIKIQFFKQEIRIAPPPHPMFNHPICFASSVRDRKAPHDASTWDSPTDILYSHADFDQPGSSALGIQLNIQEPVTSENGSLGHATLFSSAEARIIRHNAFGVAREPYDAATWDSPTDILYAHGASDEEEIYSSDLQAKWRRDSGEPSSPVTPYSAFVSTPIDDPTSLPLISSPPVASEDKVKESKCVDDLVAQANVRLVNATAR